MKMATLKPECIYKPVLMRRTAAALATEAKIRSWPKNPTAQVSTHSVSLRKAKKYEDVDPERAAAAKAKGKAKAEPDEGDEAAEHPRPKRPRVRKA